MAEAPRILLEHHLKRLKLPTFLREYEKLARQCAAEGLDHVQFLARLVELELIDRERRLVERRIKQAGFPAKDAKVPIITKKAVRPVRRLALARSAGSPYRCSPLALAWATGGPVSTPTHGPISPSPMSGYG